eukprot:scaffold1220_cov259-Pinguiococcus_pyrenoidosus.AAC.115
MGCMSAKAANLEHVQNYERQLSTGNADDFEAKYIMSETVLGKGSYALVRECLVRETRDGEWRLPSAFTQRSRGVSPQALLLAGKPSVRSQDCRQGCAPGG